MKNKITQIISYIVIMLITIVGGSFAISFLVQKFATCDKNHIQLCTTENVCVSQGLYWRDNYCNLSEKPKPEPSQYPDYEAYQLLTKVNLVKDNPSFITPNYDKIGKVDKNFIINGKFKRAYIYINTSVDNGKPLTIYDSIYLTLNYMGGHLLRSRSLPIPPSDTTQLLYDMRQIPYIENVPYSENKDPLFVDWLSLLNSRNNIPLYAFLSSWRKGGLIAEITVAYECEENNECNISVK